MLLADNVATTVVATADEARRRIDGEEFDLWVLTMKGPDDGAWELCGAARSCLPEASSLIVLGEDTPQSLERALAAGAYRYIPMPARRAELRHAIRQAVDRLHLLRENQALRREATLFKVIKNIALAMELDTLLGLILDASITLTEGAGGAVLLVDEHGRLQLGAARGIDETRSDAALFNLPPGFLESVLADGRAVQLSPNSPEIRSMRLNDRPVESALIAPLQTNGKASALSIVVRTGPPPFDSSSLRVLARLAEETALAVDNALAVHKTRELVIKDDLTASHNRRYFETYLEDELQRSKRYQTNLSLIFLDLDNLKAINNHHGHFIGSKMLQEVAHRIILTVRGIDKVVRYGGDEFCVILPETDVEGANRVAERIRQNIAASPFLTAEGLNLPMTVSIGIASCPLHARTKEELVKKADMAMFQSKAGAKNVVTVALGAAKPPAGTEG